MLQRGALHFQQRAGVPRVQRVEGAALLVGPGVDDNLGARACADAHAGVVDAGGRGRHAVDVVDLLVD
eukprot:14991241-Alexandrium_andersonii.AAC.1